jgi:signal transduction histidine kinase
VVRSLAPLADRKGLQVLARTENPTIPMVGDRKRALQVLLNLVNNALKFTEQGSVTIDVRVEGEELRVEVTDTGIGIKPKHIDMLFEAFQQVDGSAKRINEGTGLGLYLCRKLLGMIGGTIQVKSVYGKGSCFTYTMPLKLRNAGAFEGDFDRR